MPSIDVLDVVRSALEGLGLVVKRIDLVRRGGRVCRVALPGRDLAVRLVPRSEAAATAATAVWLERLTLAGIPAPKPVRIAGLLLTPIDAGNLLAVAWQHGTPIFETGWDPDAAAALGALLARTHALPSGSPIAGARRYDAAWAARIPARLAHAAALLAADASDVERVAVGLARARDALAEAWRGGGGGPIRMVHADVHAGNVLETARTPRQRALALIDADRAGIAPVALDLAFALLDHEPPTAWALLRAYRRLRPLATADLDALSKFRPLAIADNLAFLAGIDEDRTHLEHAWATLVATCVATAITEPEFDEAAASDAVPPAVTS